MIPKRRYFCEESFISGKTASWKPQLAHVCVACYAVIFGVYFISFHAGRLLLFYRLEWYDSAGGMGKTG